jgi:dTDP-L-rhamnose 4-epimerase
MTERVLVTGGAGFIGSHTALLLLERGHRVRALDALRPPVHLPGERPPWLPADVELMAGDVRDRDALARALRGVDSVLHLAAHQDYLPDFSTFFHVNTVGTALLYEVCVAERLPLRKVVVASSQAVYGEGAHRCPDHGAVRTGLRSDEQLRRGDWDIGCPRCGQKTGWLPTDESEVNPQNQYAISKHTQELIAFNLGRRHGIPTTCLRYSITQGRWQSPRNAYSGACRVFTVRARSGRPPIVFEDGGQRRDYVHVSDVARANLLALTDDRTDFQAHNVGGAEALTTLEYARVVCEAVGLDVRPEVPGYYRFGDTRHVVSASGKLRGLGWAPTLSVRDVVREYVSWLDGSGHVDDVTDAGLARMLELGALRRAAAAAAPSTGGAS